MKKEDKLANSYRGGGGNLLNKAFTLVELLAVIVLLAIVALIATPVIDNVIDSSRQRANERSIEGYANAVANEYYNQQTGGGIPVIDSDFLANVDTQGNEIKCENVLYSDDYQVVLNNCTVAEEIEQQYCYADGEHYECNDSEFLNILQTFLPNYADNSGANVPELATNMIPVRYNGTNWVYANIKEEWYDYDSKEWANAVVLNSGVTKNVGDTISEDEIALWYVWIPRYKYQLFNVSNNTVSEQLINIEFESGNSSTGTVSCVDAINQTDSEGNLISETCTNATNGNWYTHPAFTFGDEELTGFWVGKFEVSTTDDTCNSESNTTNCNKVLPVTIKAGITSFRNVSNYNMFESIKAINSTYSLNGDSHMMKNMEWGAVAYLKQSKYGLGTTDIAINDNSSYITGGGTGTAYKDNIAQSTTGNIYGVYDMSGGAWEKTMGNMVNSNGEFYASSSGFSSAPEEKYYDKYTNDTVNTTYSRGKLGDATKETRSWYNDGDYFVYPSYSWFSHGGSCNSDTSAGVFSFGRSSGISYIYYGSRAVLAP